MPERQRISDFTSTQWRWSVLQTSIARASEFIKLSVFLHVDDEEQRALNVFRDRIRFTVRTLT
jgi:hypothetical protein